ncbi:hypothetical protein GEMRC1_008633 [Eukaryota sp. GEM-RC1]
MSLSQFLEQAVPRVYYDAAVLDAEEELEPSTCVIPPLPSFSDIKTVYCFSSDVCLSLSESIRIHLKLHHPFQSSHIRYNDKRSISFYHVPSLNLLICDYLCTATPELDLALSEHLITLNPQQINTLTLLSHAHSLPVMSQVSVNVSPLSIPLLPFPHFLSGISAALINQSQFKGFPCSCLAIRDSTTLVDLSAIFDNKNTCVFEEFLKSFELCAADLNVVLAKAKVYLSRIRKSKGSYYV